MIEQLWVKQMIALHQVLVKDRQPGGEEDRRFLALALCGEVGELANEIKKDWRGDPGDRYQAIRDELADVRVYLELLAWGYDVDLDQAVFNKIPEMLTRWPEAYDAVMKVSVEHERLIGEIVD